MAAPAAAKDAAALQGPTIEYTIGTKIVQQLQYKISELNTILPGKHHDVVFSLGSGETRTQWIWRIQPSFTVKGDGQSFYGRVILTRAMTGTSHALVKLCRVEVISPYDNGIVATYKQCSETEVSSAMNFSKMLTHRTYSANPTLYATPEGVITFKMELEIYLNKPVPRWHASPPAGEPNLQIAATRVSTSIVECSSFLEGEDVSTKDVTFTFENQDDLKAHSQILALRSSYWRTLFGATWNSPTRCVQSFVFAINDETSSIGVTREAFSKFLKALYCGEHFEVEEDESPTLIMLLLELANRYQVQTILESIESKVLDAMRSKMYTHPEVCLFILECAERYDRIELKNKAVNFFVEHADFLIDLETTKDMVLRNPTLGIVISRAVLSSRSIRYDSKKQKL